jgi:hypothetical protein
MPKTTFQGPVVNQAPYRSSISLGSAGLCFDCNVGIRLLDVTAAPKSVDSGTASEGDLLGIKSRTPSAGGAGWNRGLWYTLIGLFRILSTGSFRKDCVPWPPKEQGGGARRSQLRHGEAMS